MRAVFAGVFVFAGLFLAIVFLPHWIVGKVWVIPFGIGMAVYFIILCFVALAVFNLQIGKARLLLNPSVEELERHNLIVSTDFKATRAFEINEFEDEGPYYFIELENASILYLNGQYLYEYGGNEFVYNEESNETKLSPRFPCTDFTIRRHRIEHYVIDIQCSGSLLPLETPELRDSNYVKVSDAFGRAFPEDGQIFTDWTYDVLKRCLSGEENA